MKVGDGQDALVEMDPEEIPPVVHAAVISGHKVEAVKLLREETGLGLREAKRIVDLLERQHGGAGIEDAQRFTEVGGSRGLIIIIAAIVAGYAAWRLVSGS